MLASMLAVCALLAQTPSPPSSRVAACGNDDDCVISAQANCCECCPSLPTAMPKQAFAERRCDLKQCPSCTTVRCEPAPDADSFKAVCRAGTCRAEPVTEPKRPSPQCRLDSDCLVTSFSCCERCCALPLEAMTPAQLESKRAECGQTNCAMIKCAPEHCPKVSSQQSRAVCRSNRCELVVAPTPVECETDAQCIVDYPTSHIGGCGVCGCCPGTEPVAAPVSRVAPSPFGLSQPGAKKSSRPQPAPPVSPNCSPCPNRKPATARCRAHRCTLKD